jgi:hypothetical protein
MLPTMAARVAITREPSVSSPSDGPSQRCLGSSTAGSVMARWRRSGGNEELSWHVPTGGGQLRSVWCEEEQREWRRADQWRGERGTGFPRHDVGV